MHADKPTQHFRILYYRGNSSITGIGDLFIAEGNQPPANKPGAFIVSDGKATPLDWNTIKKTPYVCSLHSGVQRMIELTLAEEHRAAQRPKHGSEAMIITGKTP
jgi:hypothetical protein